LDKLLTMSKKELTRLEVMQRLGEKRLKQREAAEILCISERHVRHLLCAYRQDGESGLSTRSVQALAILADGQVLYAVSSGEGIFRIGEVEVERWNVMLPLAIRQWKKITGNRFAILKKCEITIDLPEGEARSYLLAAGCTNIFDLLQEKYRLIIRGIINTGQNIQVYLRI